MVYFQNKSLQMITHTFSDDDGTWSCDTSDVDCQVDVPVCTCHMRQFGNEIRCHVLCKYYVYWTNTYVYWTNTKISRGGIITDIFLPDSKFKGCRSYQL